MLRTNLFYIGKKVANMAGWQIWPWDTLNYIIKVKVIIKIKFIIIKKIKIKKITKQI